MKPCYELVPNPDDPTGLPGIRCLHCRRVSFNQNDVEQRYCGACHVFHEQRPPAEERQLPMWSASGRAPSQSGEPRDPDADLDAMSHEELLLAARAMRQAIRQRNLEEKSS